MSRIQFRPQVFLDLEDMWATGAERWGEAQADRYKADLDSLLFLLADTPRLGPERVARGTPVRIYPYRSHVILYRELTGESGIEVMRIIHGRADLRRLS